jgi:hypothetical protein
MKFVGKAGMSLGVVLVAALVAVNGHGLRQTLSAEENFDSYGNISWEDEKARLDNFASELRHDPNLIGYVIVYAGRRACPGEAKARAVRAKQYLVKAHAIRADRIRWIDGGYREEATVVLQPVPRGARELTASRPLSQAK